MILAIGMLAIPARAQSPVRLEYDAPEECPSREEFLRAVESRGGTFQAAPETRARTLRVGMRKDEAGFSGTLRVEQQDESSAPREVQGRTCSEAMDGLAVVAAITLHEEETRAEPVAEPPNPASTHEVEAQPESGPRPPPPSPRGNARLRGSSYGNAETLSVPAGTLHFDLSRSITLTAGASFGLIPGLVLPRYDLSVSAASFVTAPDGRTRLLGTNVLRVTWSWLGGNTIHRARDGFETRVMGFMAGVGSCQALTYDTEGLVAMLCGDFRIGAMLYDLEKSGGEDQELAIGSASLGADLRYNFTDYFHVGLKFGGDLTLSNAPRRPDGSDLFQTSLFGGHVLGGLGVQF